DHDSAEKPQFSSFTLALNKNKNRQPYDDIAIKVQLNTRLVYCDAQQEQEPVKLLYTTALATTAEQYVEPVKILRNSTESEARCVAQLNKNKNGASCTTTIREPKPNRSNGRVLLDNRVFRATTTDHDRSWGETFTVETETDAESTGAKDASHEHMDGTRDAAVEVTDESVTPT
ncbi:hypothetical protein EXIGLDRAFT_772614, partial [Exidia glandulosa HHB12029]